MTLRFLGWEQIVKMKTKRSTPLSILRWTLIQHATKSLDQISDEQTKKKVLKEEMTWLNHYWGQPIPKYEISPKYWQRLLTTKSLNTRRDLYE